MGIGTMGSTSYIRPLLRLRATGFDTIRTYAILIIARSVR